MPGRWVKPTSSRMDPVEMICAPRPHGMPTRYILVRRLGIGSVGEVWEAQCDGRPLALKILHGISPSRTSLEKECRLLMELSHPHIVVVYGVHASAEGRAFIEMEKVDGPSLSLMAAGQGGVLPWEILKPLAMQLCSALGHAHSKGVVHRDVKPSNLLLDATGALKLVDFGCAALTAQSQLEMTRTVEMVSSGTLAFMSPQQINGEAPMPADDIYAAGATLHTLLVGVPPFSEGHLIHQILNASPPTVTGHQRQRGVTNPVSPGLVRVIAACLDKKPARRPATAEALAAMLDGESNGGTNRRKAILTMAGCGLALAFCGAISIQRHRMRASRNEAGFQPIFDGRTLDGWHGHSDVWKVDDGAICGHLQALRMADASNWRKEFLDWTGPAPDDFELRLQVLLKLPEIDSGNLGIRYRIAPGPPPVAYDLDFEPIWKYNCGLREIGGRDMLARPTQIVRCSNQSGITDLHLLGHVADEKRLKEAYRDNAWNDLTIRAVGNRLIHALNGTVIVDCTDDDPVSRRLKGGIALKIMLYYGPWIEARFRHIRLRAV